MATPQGKTGGLVLNAGSSSIKVALFGRDLSERLRLEASGIGGAGRLSVAGAAHDLDLPDNTAALRAIAAALSAQGVALGGLDYVAHRVVHGGRALSAPQRITPEIRTSIEACIPLAPLHNPHHLAAIDWIAAQAPDVAQIACFDTGFHATIPDLARRYALPDTKATQGLIRYGFHGISYAALVAEWRDVTGAPLPERLIAFHLGNGASICAIRAGRSVATTMGYSPLGGLTMGTRSGDLDPGAVLKLAGALGVAEAEALLTRGSGLLGLSGESADMRALSQSGAPKARFARDHFAYWAARHAGGMIAACGGADALAFTGGIGENDADIRAAICAHLDWLGPIETRVIPAREERHIARQAQDILAQDPAALSPAAAALQQD